MADAKLSFGVLGPTMDFRTEVTVTESNTQRILNYLVNGSHYGDIVDESGQFVRKATPEEAAQAFALGTLRGLLDQTVRYEKLEAAKAAEAAVSDIPM